MRPNYGQNLRKGSVSRKSNYDSRAHYRIDSRVIEVLSTWYILSAYFPLL